MRSNSSPSSFQRGFSVTLPYKSQQAISKALTAMGNASCAFQREQVGRHFARMQIGAGDDPGRQRLAQHTQIATEGLGQIPIGVESRALP